MTNYGKTKIFVAGSQIFVLFTVHFQTGAFQFSLVRYQKQTSERYRPVENYLWLHVQKCKQCSDDAKTNCRCLVFHCLYIYGISVYLTFSAENTKYFMALFISMEKVSEGFFVCLFI